VSNQDLYPHHEESGHPVVLWIVPFLAVVATPGLVWAVAERPMAMRLEMMLSVTVGVAIVGALLLAILSHGFSHRIRWALSVTAITTLALFQWPILTFAGNASAKALRIPFLSNAAPVLIAVALIWLATRNGGDWQFAAIIGVGTVAVVTALIISVAPVVELASTSDRGDAAADSPDVLLLVLDGYARADILQEDFQFDNDPFLQDLEELGFTIADQARANYGYTYASMATMLNLDYAFDVGYISNEDNEVMRNALSGNPPMMDLFRRAGYEIVFTENAWEGSHCAAPVDRCIRDGLVERVVWGMTQFTIFAPVLEATRPHPFNSVSYEHLESLGSHVMDDRTKGVPRFTVSHLVLPHAPFLRDAECEYVFTAARRSFAASNEEQVASRRDLYADQMTCVNQKVIEAIRQIVTARPDTLVMITGDHGSASARIYSGGIEQWSERAIEERVSILSAYRLPGCEYEPYAHITPVNGTRMVANCALDAGLTPLPDRTVWAPPLRADEVVTLDAKAAASLATSAK
jgi:hypothetical protein